VLGVYLVDKENLAEETVAELGGSKEWAVEQQWLALGSSPIPDALAKVTVRRVQERIPKFVLLNQLLAAADLAKYAFIVICDDDAALPAGFLDDYLRLARRYDLALCQPARTHDSYIDHPFVEQLDGLTARWTQFVEIGPVFSIRRDAFPTVLPFDEGSPMGWGYDFVWGRDLREAGLRMGVIDATPVGHSLRKPVAEYSWAVANEQMQNFLKGRPHLSKREAFFIVESYV
jgi:hypothetical protein